MDLELEKVGESELDVEVVAVRGEVEGREMSER